MLNYLFGMKTKEFVILAADTIAVQQVWNISREDNKFFPITSKTSMVGVGDGGDMDQFGEYVAKNMVLYEMRNGTVGHLSFVTRLQFNFVIGYPMSPKGVANFARREIVRNLRTADPHLVNFIVGGYDTSGPYVALIDYLGTCFTNEYVMFGYGAFFCYSILDRIYREEATVDEAIEIVKKCFIEVKKRFIIDLGELKVQLINADGVRDLPNISLSV
ncbi:proteasome subunit beta type 2 [Trichuris trichiura]|uniref:Proteasome subunit beta type 2 n=1 Tax=Trichuris trichiura TaxID=36087 RepID=A0A077YZS4_TRITR|nr:proteasome subunit beta type 2 [Trichuris trichiura]